MVPLWNVHGPRLRRSGRRRGSRADRPGGRVSASPGHPLSKRWIFVGLRGERRRCRRGAPATSPSARTLSGAELARVARGRRCPSRDARRPRPCPSSPRRSRRDARCARAGRRWSSAPCFAASAPSTKFIFGLPMKPATKQVLRGAVELERRADLLDVAGVQHHDLVGHGHRLDLVVGDVDHRLAELLVQLGDLEPHGAAQRRVEVRQRLVEQEGRGLAHDGAADRDALALAAGELAGAALEVVGEVEDAGGVRHLLVDRRPGPRRPSSAGRRCSSPTVMCG